MRIGESLEALSDETIIEIFEQLAPRERARFSTINKRLHSLLYPWSDINRITAHKVGIVLASDRCILEVHDTGTNEKTAQSDINLLTNALRTSPFIQKLVISNIDYVRTISPAVFTYLSNLRELTVPCDIFDKESDLHDKIKAIFSIKRLLVLRILKRFDTPRKAINIVHAEHIEKLQTDAIRMLKLQGVSLTAAAMEAIAKKFSNSLKYLCLMGTLVHTPDGAIYLKALCNLRCLSKLTLPPSLLSLSSKPLYYECRMLQQLTVKYLCACVYESEIVETRYFIKKLLPPTLKELCLHDPTHLVAKDLKNDEFRKLHFKVTFCKRADSLYQQEWMHGHCELLSHMVWVQPYKHFNTEYPHPVPGWWFFMSENVDTAEESTEVTAVEESPTPQQPVAQLQLPPNEDPGEMMMATITRFFERMIDDQLNAEFGGNASTNLAILENPNNNVVTPNTASQLPVPANQIDGHSGSSNNRSRHNFVVISRSGRGNISRPSRIPLQTSTQSAPPIQRVSPTEVDQEETSSATAGSPDSEDSGQLEENDNNEAQYSGSTTSTTTTTTNSTTSTSRLIRRNTRLNEP